ncbi:winged helix-turn-helix transcriptional regulator [Streptomyces sp. NPDC021020]|uniref:winged helix-turn-helix transcriptional regulator n=1 Tax=Streptomyces sp. NPDC021020 TaxID=3365109 RepID=UPI0037BA0ED3
MTPATKSPAVPGEAAASCAASSPPPLPPGPPFLADCGLRAATDLLAHTWDAVVLAGLRPGPRRRRDLLTWLGGASDKALTETLRRLQANGLVARQAHPAAPPHVDYALTPLGVTFVDGPLHALAAWTLAHADDLLAAQESAAEGVRPAARRP